MKLRCTTNSIRIRIRKSELEQLAKAGKLEEEVLFPGGNRFGYSLGFRKGVETFSASFESDQMQIHLPAQQAVAWIADDTVSLEMLLDLPNGQSLQLLIEKDFPCKDRVDEDKTDFFGDLAEQNDAVC